MTLQILASTVKNHVTCEESGGEYYVFEITLPPGEGIPPHIHTLENEVICVLEGELDLVFDGERHSIGVGAVKHFPIGIMHGFFNVSDKQARALVYVSPGTSFEKFFLGLDALSREPEVNMEAIAKHASDFGMTFV